MAYKCHCPLVSHKGLERFANADESPERYQALAKGFPSFWPLPLEDAKGNDLSWQSALLVLQGFTPGSLDTQPRND